MRRVDSRFERGRLMRIPLRQKVGFPGSNQNRQFVHAGPERAFLDHGIVQQMQPTIDVVRFNRDVSGVPEKDALVIRFGRQLFREKKVSPDTFAKAEALFGKRGTVELVALMGDYA